jgi:PAS domain S-box-containing protein
MKTLLEKMTTGLFGAALLLLGGIGLVFHWSIQRLKADEHWVLHTEHVIRTIDHTFDQLRFVEGGRRGYLLTGKEKYREMSRQSEQQMELSMTQLQQLTVDNPRQQQTLSEMKPLLQQRSHLIGQSFQRFQTNPEDRATQADLTDRGMLLQNQIQSQIATMQAEEQRLLSQRIAATDGSLEVISSLTTMGYVLSFGLLGGVFWLLKRQQQLRQSAAIVNILETITDAFVSLDRNWRYTYVNRRAGEMLGRRPEDLMGKHIWTEFPEGIGQTFYQKYYQAVATQQPIQLEEFYPPWNRWFDNRIYPSSEGLTIFFQDITPRKQAELSLQEAKDTLEKTVQERTIELQNLNQILQTSNQELEQFSHIVSHDLQEPLRAIASHARLLTEDLGDTIDPVTQESLHFITEGADRMRSLIQDLLAYARVGEPQVDGMTDCNEAVKQAIDHLQAGAIVTCDPLPLVKVNATQLVQLFQNLIGNAIKFQREQPPQIHVGFTNETFWVQDNGIGIPPQHLSAIFDIFRRLHTRRKYPGTGIGLAICQKIVDRYGGRIWAESEPGVGTTFFFTLPQASDFGTIRYNGSAKADF